MKKRLYWVFGGLFALSLILAVTATDFYVSSPDLQCTNTNNITSNRCLDGANLSLNGVYGELWMINESGYTFSIAVSEVYYNLTILETDELEGFNNSNGTLTALHEGFYSGDFHISFSGQTGSTHGAAIMINGNRHNACYNQRKLGSSDVGNMGGTCIFELVKGDNITLGIDDDDATPNDISIITSNLNVVKIG